MQDGMFRASWLAKLWYWEKCGGVQNLALRYADIQNSFL